MPPWRPLPADKLPADFVEPIAPSAAMKEYHTHMHDIGDAAQIFSFFPLSVGLGTVIAQRNRIAAALFAVSGMMLVTSMVCYTSSTMVPNSERIVMLRALRVRLVGPILSGARDPVIVRMPRIYFGE